MVHLEKPRSHRGELGRLLISAPPGSAKSQTASVLFPAFFLANNHAAQIVTASHTQDLAERPVQTSLRHSAVATPARAPLVHTRMAGFASKLLAQLSSRNADCAADHGNRPAQSHRRPAPGD